MSVPDSDSRPAIDREAIDIALARRLVDSQFPQWRGLPLRHVEHAGWDNRTFRLGDALSVRLPTGPWYAQQVEKEQHWLPLLAPQVPLPIPEPVAVGSPDDEYPFAWSVYRWLEGRPAATAGIGDPVLFAADVAGFLAALQGAEAQDGPAPGEHNFFRGGPPGVYADETHRTIDGLGDRIDGALARRIWSRAEESRWDRPPVWFHGDIAVGNLLMSQDRLAAVIDFGTSGVGDPACDLALAWTHLDGDARDAFRTGLAVDDATWDRGRGWAMWKALITLNTLDSDRDGDGDSGAQVTLDRIFAEFPG